MSANNKKRYIVFGAGAIILCAVLLSAVKALGRLKSGKTDTAQGLAYIKQAEEADIQAVRHKIKTLKENAGETSFGEDYKIIFEDSVIMGDSVPSALTSYGHLFASSVTAKAGLSYVNQIEIIKGLAPEIIFISYGTDEIAAGGADLDGFTELYARVLDSVGQAMPDSRIFVNSIFPARADAAAKEPEFGHLKEYNEKLRELCDKRNIAFIDNGDLAAERFYEGDGLHFKSDFYPYWLEQMAEAAELSR